MRLWTHSVFCIAAVLGLGSPGWAQEVPYPQKGTIEITVLFPAGSPTAWRNNSAPA